METQDSSARDRGAEPHGSFQIVTLRLITDAPRCRLRRPPARPRSSRPQAFVDLFEHAGTLLADPRRPGPLRRRQPGLRARARVPAGGARRPLAARLPAPPRPDLGGRATPPACHGWQEGFVELLGRHRHADGSWRWLLWSGSAHGDHWYAARQGRHRVDPPRAPRRPRPADRRCPTARSSPTSSTHALDRHERSRPAPRRALHRHRLLPPDQRQRRPRGAATACWSRPRERLRERGARRRHRRRASAATSSRSCSSCSRATTRRSPSRAACSRRFARAVRARQRRRSAVIGERRPRDRPRLAPQARRPRDPRGRHRDVPRQGRRPRPLRDLRRRRCASRSTAA